MILLMLKLLLVWIVVSMDITEGKLPHPIRHFEIATIPFVPKEYSLSFDVMSTSHNDTWNSYIHFDTRAKYAGLKKDGVWFTWGIHPDRLHICSPDYGHRSYCFSKKFSSSKDEWINVRFTQQKYLTKYHLKIYINGNEEYTSVSQTPREYRDVKIHSGDGWYRAKPGSFKNLHFKFFCPRSLVEDKIGIPGNSVIALLDNMDMEYHVTFDYLYERSWERRFGLLRFMTNKNDSGNFKNVIEMPVIVDAGPKMNGYFICRDTDKECTKKRYVFEKSKWVNIKVQQTLFGNHYVYKVVVNGKELYSLETLHPKSFKNVNVIADGHGFIRNLQLNGYCPFSQVKKVDPVHGDWGEWSKFTICSKPCGSGKRYRTRTCNDPSPAKGGLTCLFSDGSGKRGTYEKETKLCNTRACPVDGNWGEWSKFNICSKPCGGGKRYRKRTCNDPSPRNGGLSCLLSNGRRGRNERETKNCNKKACPVDGSWGKWSKVSICSKPCGGGERHRSRTCNDPSPSKGGLSCLLSDGSGKRGRKEKKSMKCNIRACPVDGNWGEWSKYNICSKPCGGGNRYRNRTCNDPSPANGGLSCLLADGSGKRGANEKQTRKCNTRACPVDGNWGQWSKLSICSKPCGGGERYRDRTCNDPSPAHGGLSCILSDGSGKRGRNETKSFGKCNTKACPVDGNWGKWSSFSKCSKTCGGGKRYRERTCSNPSAANGGLNCLLSDGSGRRGKDDKETQTCNKKACPANPWELQKSNVCFGSKGNSFGTFTIKKSGHVKAIKLVHKSGSVGCSGAGHSNWGCKSNSISIGITHKNNKVIIPDKLSSAGWIDIPSYTSMSKELVLDSPTKDNYVMKNDKIRLWYGEDLRGYTEGDNPGGKSCADVYAIIADPWQMQKENVCFGSKGNTFGTFKMKQTGFVKSLKLVHKSGSVGCFGSGHSNWGCKENDISIAVTHKSNKLMFPNNLNSAGWIDIPNYTSMSKELVFNNSTKDNYVLKDAEMRLWYGEDLRDYTEGDNVGGKACADVLAIISRS